MPSGQRQVLRAPTRGLSSLTKLVTAWAVTLLLLGSVVLWLQLSWEPPHTAAQAEEPTTPVEEAAVDTPTAEEPSEPDADAAAVDTPATATAADDAEAAAPPQDDKPAPEPATDMAVAEPTSEPSKTEPDVAATTPPQEREVASAAPATSPLDTVAMATGPVLAAAPAPGLIEDSAFGPLPVIADDGRAPWQVYARPGPAGDQRPRIAVVLTGLGLSGRVTERAIGALPGEISLAFSPYGERVAEWADAARAAGHETLLMVPMEPYDYPANDPGPQTLLTSVGDGENLARLHSVMARFPGYVGLVNHMGSRYTASEPHMQTLMTEMGQRGLMVLDARSSRYSVAARVARDRGVPRAYNNRYIDNELSAVEIDRMLTELENVAESVGTAVGIGRPYPVTIERISRWAQSLPAKGIDLVPVTAVANRQPVR